MLLFYAFLAYVVLRHTKHKEKENFRQNYLRELLPNNDCNNVVLWKDLKNTCRFFDFNEIKEYLEKNEIWGCNISSDQYENCGITKTYLKELELTPLLI